MINWLVTWGKVCLLKFSQERGAIWHTNIFLTNRSTSFQIVYNNESQGGTKTDIINLGVYCISLNDVEHYLYHTTISVTLGSECSRCILCIIKSKVMLTLRVQFHTQIISTKCNKFIYCICNECLNLFYYSNESLYFDVYFNVLNLIISRSSKFLEWIYPL